MGDYMVPYHFSVLAHFSVLLVSITFRSVLVRAFLKFTEIQDGRSKIQHRLTIMT